MPKNPVKSVVPNPRNSIVQINRKFTFLNDRIPIGILFFEDDVSVWSFEFQVIVICLLFGFCDSLYIFLDT